MTDISKLVLAIVIGVVILVVYYVASPYQNCVRDSSDDVKSRARAKCSEVTAW